MAYTCAKKSVNQSEHGLVNEIRDIYMCNEVDQPVTARVSEVNEIRDIYMCSEVGHATSQNRVW